MSDDLNNKIKQIADLLGQGDMPDNLKGLLSLLGASGGKEEVRQKPSEPVPLKEDRAVKSDLEENLDLVRKMKNVMDKLNTRNDPRINLLTAIRPFLNNSRQKRLGNCIKILQVSKLTNFMDDHEKSGF